MYQRAKDNFILFVLLGLDKSSSSYWIGGSDIGTEGNFTWTDGTPLGAYENFKTGEPNDNRGNEDCLSILNNGEWNDSRCYGLQHFICEVQRG